MSGSWYNFGVYGYGQPHYMNDINTSNTVDGKPVYYWINMSDMSVPFDAGHVALVNCTHITVQGLNLTNNYQGILLAYTQNSTITQNNITDTSNGITLHHSLFNNVSGNNIAESNNYGIYLSDSSNNSVTNNIIVDSWSGIYVYSSFDNKIVENNVTSSWYYGVYIGYSSNNNVCKNNIAENNYGVYLSWWCSNNSIITNNIANNNYGVYIYQSNDNKFYHNNFSNTMQVNSDSSKIYGMTGTPQAAIIGAATPASTRLMALIKIYLEAME